MTGTEIQVDDEEELKRVALDNISKSQRTFKYPIRETEDENGKVQLHLGAKFDHCKGFPFHSTKSD